MEACTGAAGGAGPEGFPLMWVPSQGKEAMPGPEEHSSPLDTVSTLRSR